MNRRLALVAALALTAVAGHAAAGDPPGTSLPLVQGGTTYQQWTYNDGQRFRTGQLLFGWTGSAPKYVAVDPTTGDVQVDIASDRSGGATAALQQTALNNQTAANASLASLVAQTIRSGSGGFVAIPTAPGANGAPLPAGVVGTRIYTDSVGDSVTYAIEPASQCGSSAPTSRTRTITNAMGGADENVTGGLVLCVTAATGTPVARAY